MKMTETDLLIVDRAVSIGAERMPGTRCCWRYYRTTWDGELLAQVGMERGRWWVSATVLPNRGRGPDLDPVRQCHAEARAIFKRLERSLPKTATLWGGELGFTLSQAPAAVALPIVEIAVRLHAAGNEWLDRQAVIRESVV